MKKQRIWTSLHPFYEKGSSLGRIEANHSFIRALLKADPFDAYHFFLPHPDDVAFLESCLQDDFPALWRGGRFSVRLHREAARAFSERDYYCLHLSDPFLRYSDAMSLRNAVSRRIFPISAPTHSLSYADYGERLLCHIWPGVTPRDAVVATSRAGAKVVENYYLALKGVYKLESSPAVRHIPLGVEPSIMPAPEEKAALGQGARERLDLGDELIFLVFARISYQSKMDLLPILRAFKRAEALGLAPGSYRLVLAGWLDEGDTFGADMQKLAQNLGIKCTVVPRPDNETRKALYAAASVFLSPSDNLQETFGLTMLEAAVSGLPVIASDFDGYKDLVDHNVSGVLVPTYGPDETPASDAASLMAPASEYHLLLAQQCVVDVGEMGAAMARLAADAPLREAMGRAGRERALVGYTWEAVIERHLELWDELNSTPCKLDGEPAARPRQLSRHPMHPPYMDIFGDYYSERAGALAEAGREAVWTEAGEAVYRGRDFPVIYRLVEDRIDMELLKKLLFMARRPVGIAALRAELAKAAGALPYDRDFLLLWALKHDLLELVRLSSA